MTDIAKQISQQFADVLMALPLLADDLYLRMQTMNLQMVDYYVRFLEEDLRQELLEQERTPLPDVFFVSALSQLWIFGLYELLRTWRQRMMDILKFSDSLRKMPLDRWDDAVERKKPQLPRGGGEKASKTGDG